MHKKVKDSHKIIVLTTAEISELPIQECKFYSTCPRTFGYPLVHRVMLINERTITTSAQFGEKVVRMVVNLSTFVGCSDSSCLVHYIYPHRF